MPVDFVVVLIPLVALLILLVALIRRRRTNWWLVVGAEAALAILFFALYILPGIRLTQAASTGDVNAQYELGNWYALRFGGNWPDREKSLYWLEKAAAGNHADALCLLGRANLFGAGWVDVQPNKAKARELLTRAAKLGNEEAKGLLKELEATK